MRGFCKDVSFGENVYVTYDSEGWLRLGWFSSEWRFLWMWLVSLMLLWPAAVWKVKVTQSCPTLWNLYTPWNSPGQNTGVGSLSLLQGIFPTQESKPGLLPCRQILYQLSHQGSPRILEWVAYPFSIGSSWPRNWTGVSCIAGGFFTS